MRRSTEYQRFPQGSAGFRRASTWLYAPAPAGCKRQSSFRCPPWKGAIDGMDSSRSGLRWSWWKGAPADAPECLLLGHRILFRFIVASIDTVNSFFLPMCLFKSWLLQWSCYSRSPYCSSSIGSHHSVLAPSPGISWAICWNQLSFAALSRTSGQN